MPEEAEKPKPKTQRVRGRWQPDLEARLERTKARRQADYEKFLAEEAAARVDNIQERATISLNYMPLEAQRFIIGNELIAVFNRLSISEDERIVILKGLLDKLVSAPAESKGPERPAQVPELPSQAPEQWSARPSGRAENPVSFIKRVYAPWIGQGLTRAHLRDLDPVLYNALATWTRRHPEDQLDLPSRPHVRRSQEMASGEGPLVPIDRLSPEEQERLRAYRALKMREYRNRL